MSESPESVVSLLGEAADHLDRLAGAVASGPWQTERYFMKYRSDLMPDQWRVGVNDSNDNEITSVPARFDVNDPGTEHHWLAAEHAAWIAAMSPAVAPVLSAWLRRAARTAGTCCLDCCIDVRAVELARLVLRGTDSETPTPVPVTPTDKD